MSAGSQIQAAAPGRGAAQAARVAAAARAALQGLVALLFGRRPSHAPSRLGTLALMAGVVVLALGLGYLCAVFPTSFMSKVSVLLLGAVVVLWAFAASKAGESPNVGRATRTSINIWVFLMGVCPAYLPFKFGPLPGLNPLRIMFAAVLITAIHGVVTSAQLRARLAEVIGASKAVFAFVAGLLAWQFFCALVGDQPVFSLYYCLKVLLPAFVMFIIAMTYYRSWQDMQRTAAFLVVGVTITCLIGIVEWRTQTNVFLRFFPQDEDELANLGWIILDKTRGGDYRVSATFSHPLPLAEFLCMALPFAAVLAFSARQRWMRLLSWAVLPLLLGMIYLAHTRSSLIAGTSSVLVMGLMLGLRVGRDRKHPAKAVLGWGLVTVLVAVVLMLSSTLTYLAKGRTEGEIGSSQARVTMLSRAQVLLAERPVQGYGPGLGAIKIGRTAPGQRTPTIDSYFLSTVIEGGFVALSLFVLGMATLLIKTARAAIRTRGEGSWQLIALSAAVFASLIVKIALSLTDNLELLYLLVGMAAVSLTLSRPGTSPAPAPSGASWRRPV